jgi:hypothetical protein
MMLSAALTLVGSTCFAQRSLVVHYGSGEGPVIPLVELYSAKLKDIERKSREGAYGEFEADDARKSALRAFVDDLRARESRWWILRGDRSALVIVGLAAASIVALSSLGVVHNVGDQPRLGVSTLDALRDPDIARLATYAQSMPSPTSQKLTVDRTVDRALPDVETMITRLTVRLENQPDDVAKR